MVSPCKKQEKREWQQVQREITIIITPGYQRSSYWLDHRKLLATADNCFMVIPGNLSE